MKIKNFLQIKKKKKVRPKNNYQKSTTAMNIRVANNIADKIKSQASDEKLSLNAFVTKILVEHLEK